MLLATWNVNSLRVRLEQVKAGLSANSVDAIALRETKVPDETFPHEEIRALGFKSIMGGQKSYNAVALVEPKRRRSPTVFPDGMTRRSAF